MKLVSKDSGQLVEVPASQVREAYLSGQFGVPEGERIPVQLSDGRIGSVEATDLPDLDRLGGSVLEPSDVQFRERVRKYSGPGQAAVAGLEGVASGVTLGLSEPALGAALGPEYQEAAKAREELSPVASFAGEALGTLAPLFFTGGTGVGARVAAATPTALSARAALAAERGAARLLGEGATAAGRIGRAGGRLGAGGAIEGGIQAGTREVSEALLGDHELTADRWLSAVGTGALLGAGVGAGLGFAGRGLGEAFRRTKISEAEMQRVAETAFGDAAQPGLGRALASDAPDVAASLRGRTPEEARELLASDLGPAGQMARKILQEGDEIRTQSARELKVYLDDMLEAFEASADDLRGGAKLETIRKTVSQNDDNLVASADQIAAYRRWVDAALGDPVAYGEVARLRKVRNALQGAQEGIEIAFRTQNSAKAFAEMDNLKRAIGREASFYGRMVPGGADGATIAMLRSMYDGGPEMGSKGGLLGLLESADLWGEMGVRQQELNRWWSKLLDNKRNFDRVLTTNYGRSERANASKWVGVSRVDSAKMDAYVNNLTNPKADTTHEFVRRFTDGLGEYLDVVKRDYSLSPISQSFVDKAQSSIPKISDALERAETSLVFANQARALREAQSSGIVALIPSGLFGGALSGGVVGGPFGAVAGAALGKLTQLATNPWERARVIGILESAARNQESQWLAPVRKLLSAKSGKKPSKVVRQLPRFIERERDEFKRRKDSIERAVKEPGYLAGEVAKRNAPIVAHAPRTAEAMARAAARKATYLADKLPFAATGSSLVASKEQYNDADMEKFLRIARALDDPASLTQHAVDGTIRKEMVDAVEEVFPKLLDAGRVAILQEITDKDVPYDARLGLGMLLGIPTDKSIVPDFVARAQDMFGQKPPPPPVRRSTAQLRISDKARSTGERLDNWETISEFSL